MNRMEINSPGAGYQIQMKKIMAGEATVNRVEANKAYLAASSYDWKNGQGKTNVQSLRWMDRYLLSLFGVKETDTITLRGTLELLQKGHCLGSTIIRPNTAPELLQKQKELIAEGTGLELFEYMDSATKIKKYALQIPFTISNPDITVELDELEQSYIITIQELPFKRACNEVLKSFLSWWDGHIRQQVSPELLFLKCFCDIKSDRIKSEEQKRTTRELEQRKQEDIQEWEARTAEYVQNIDWDSVKIELGFSMVDPMGAAVELHLNHLPENELSRLGILLPKKLHFAELEHGIVIEQQLNYMPERFKTRLLCAMVKHLNEAYKAKQPDFYEYKKWHTICELQFFSMKFSKKFTYYSEEQLGIVQGEGISFAEWEQNIVPGGYEDLY